MMVVVLSELGAGQKDVLVKVDKFIFLADFVVLDMKEDKDVLIILGHPFMNTIVTWS